MFHDEPIHISKSIINQIDEASLVQNNNCKLCKMLWVYAF